MDDRWQGLSLEFGELGAEYSAEQLADPDWCARELARKGYSISLTMVTTDYVREKLAFKPENQDLFPAWTYQLWGKEYESRGDHNTFLTRTLAESAATALFNVCRLESLDKKKH